MRSWGRPNPFSDRKDRGAYRAFVDAPSVFSIVLSLIPLEPRSMEPLPLRTALPLPGTLPGSDADEFVVDPPVTLPPEPLPPGAPCAKAVPVVARTNEAAKVNAVIRMAFLP